MNPDTLPFWASRRLSCGNVSCATCLRVQSDSFKACIYCCTHDLLGFTENWYGPDDGGAWGLGAECVICGKNYDFSRQDLIQKYKAVRIK